MNTKLIPLIRASQDHYTAACSDPVTKTAVLANALPVAWFGNSDEYFNSECKVVTVGLNPKSGMNPAWHNVNPKTVSAQQLGVLYNDYFEGNHLHNVASKDWEKAYLEWFKSIDTKVRDVSAHMVGNRRLNASYNGKLIPPNKAKMCNTMLHLDLYSTAPTVYGWSSKQNPTAARKRLITGVSSSSAGVPAYPGGTDLFRLALSVFDPDYVLIGVGAGTGNGLQSSYFSPFISWPATSLGKSGQLLAAAMDVNLNAYCGSQGLNTSSRFVWMKPQVKPLMLCPSNVGAQLM